MRHLHLPLLLLTTTWASCTRDGDPGYTALMRYAVTDFRIAGIDARPADPEASLPLQPGQPIALTALVLSRDEAPVDLEWVDCPSYAWGSPDAVAGSVDCLGTPREIRLGRGTRASYIYTIPDLPFPGRDLDAGPWFDDAGNPIVPDAAWIEEPRPEPVPYDDAIVYLRATQGEQVRYARKSFLGLFGLGLMGPPRHPAIENFSVDGRVRDNDGTRALTVQRGQRLDLRFDVVDVDENRPVQWFVTGGTLSRRGLTLYVDQGTRDGPEGPLPWFRAQNTWTVPAQRGHHQLVAVVGGDYGALPYLRLDVEVP